MKKERGIVFDEVITLTKDSEYKNRKYLINSPPKDTGRKIKGYGLIYEF